tara:strand:- start:30 stop:572 length:543 start_codon:yes stop_codon:yes gene_type:complete
MPSEEIRSVDFGFIKELEGSETTGYVPKEDGKVLGNSGVTIASGFDLGQRGVQDLVGLPEEIQIKLAPYAGLQGDDADAIASSLEIDTDEADIINEFAKQEAMSRLSRQWMGTTGNNFESLPSNKQTAIASVAFQYGDLAKKTPNFWRQVTSDDWEGAKRNLLDFKDKYPTRRKKEASLL